MRALPALPPGVRAVLAVAATSLFMVLVAWATLIGPDAIFTGPGVIEREVTAPPRTCLELVVTTGPDGNTVTSAPEDNLDNLPLCEEVTASSGNQRDSGPRAEPPLVLKVLVWVFVLAILGVILALVLYIANIAREQRIHRRRTARRESVDFATLDDPAALVDAIVEDAEAQDAVLREGDPRNAIVAAWQRFEVQGERAGVPRRGWETSSEYTLRILDLVSADSGTVNRLAGLYRMARFSEHPVTEAHRAEALEALTTIRRGMGVRS
jgi:hypothetical protein